MSPYAASVMRGNQSYATLLVISISYLGCTTLVGKALSFTNELSLFLSLFYQCTVLSSHAEDGNHMYFGGSVVGKASTIGIGISPTPPLTFTGGQKVRNLASFKTSLNVEI